MRGDATVEAWFLRPSERGNPATSIDRRRDDSLGYSTGNHIELLVHGAPYFEALYRELCDTAAGDLVAFTDWRGDPDEHLAGGQSLGGIDAVLVRTDQSAPAETVYLNRCADGGCTVRAGFESSVNNTSSIISGTRLLTPYPHGDASFAAVATCVREVFARYNVTITTTAASPPR